MPGEKFSPSFESVDTERVNNTFYAIEQSGADGGAQIQNALDAADNALGRAEVVVSGSPDDLSGFGDAEESNGYLISQPLTVPSNTLLRFVNVYAYLDDAANDNIIRNTNAESGDATRDSNISIVGEGNTRIDGNPANQNRQSPTYESFALSFYKVDGLTLDGLDVGPTEAWAVAIEDATDVTIPRLEFSQDDVTSNQDGLHLQGPLENVWVGSLTGTSGDDALAIECVTSQTFNTNRGSGGDVSGVVVEDHNVKPLGNVAMAKLWAGDGFVMEDVTIKNLHHHEEVYRGIILGETSAVTTAPTADEFRDITFGRLDVFVETQVIQAPTAFTNLRFGEVRGIHGEAGMTSNNSYEKNGLTIDDWRTEFAADSSGFSGLFFAGSGTFRDVDVRYIRLDGSDAGSPGGSKILDWRDATYDNCRVGTAVGRSLDQGVRIRTGTWEGVRVENTEFASVSDEYNMEPGVIIGGWAQESANAEEPQETFYEPGDKVNFTDTGDGSGNGNYVRRPNNGSPTWDTL